MAPYLGSSNAALLLLLVVVVAAVVAMATTVQADAFDDRMRSRMKSLDIRGAAVAMFDTSKMSNPIVRG